MSPDGGGWMAAPGRMSAWGRWRRLFPRGDRRRWLLPLLLTLVLAVLGTMIWLASVYETAQVQEQVERSAVSGAQDVRQGLARDLQSLQALQTQPMNDSSWQHLAASLLYERRELVQLSWLDLAFQPHQQAQSPYERLTLPLAPRQPQLQLTCTLAAQSGMASYSPSYFVSSHPGEALGQELLDVCQVIRHGPVLAGYQVATYSLKALLTELIAKPLQRSHEVSFTDADGARLAVINTPLRRSARAFVAQQVIELPGSGLTLKLAFWHTAPGLFPNVLTGVVTLLSIALITVVSMLAKDMRRRQRAEQDVAAALAFRHAMEDSLVTGLRARDLAGRISYVNPAFCEMVGFGSHELLGSAMPAPYWPPECIDTYRERQLRLLSASDPLPPRTGYESLFMRKDGTRFPVLIFEAPLRDAKGEQAGWMSAVIDISEQRRIEELSRAGQERLQATARLATVGEMASLISHEINQPLAAIASYAHGSLNLLVQAEAQTTSEQARRQQALRSGVQQIANQAERAGKVITSVRDFVQRRHQAHEWVQPHQLQQALEPLLRLQARKLGVTLVWHIEPGLPALRCDRIMIEQVLLNLARNGMQAMEQVPLPQRRLLIQAERWRPLAPAVPGDTGDTGDTASLAGLRFSVADQGIGIDAERGAQLFSRFFSTKPEGMGLGLSLCRTVVEQHGGALHFEPNAPCGTIFRFTLPLGGSAEGAALVPPNAATSTASAP